MTLERQLRFWLGALAGFVLFLWLFKGVLLPFVAGIALAYLLDPVADRLENWGFSRGVAALTIVLAIFIGLVVGLILVVPLLGHQLSGLVERLPTLFARLQELVGPYFDGELRKLLGGDVKSLEGGMQTALSQGAGWITKLLQSLWNGGQAIASVVSILVIAPVVAAYMLVDWDRMIAGLDDWVPPRHRDTVRLLAGRMNDAVSGFVRGQVSVCVVMGIYYGLGLALVGLEFGLLIGLMSGLLGIVPYVGFGSGLVVGLIVALVQYWPDWHGLALVAAIFAGGQALESYVLTPSWVGRSVGLHPVWLLFSLFAFGSLFGFVGMLVAVPTSAAIGVLARFSVEQYLASPLYLGEPAASDPVETRDG
ncbi:AI-2E family transporter [Pinisolibacter sp.]|uniref:AI-2E family transporter n=1 Tax=Pinisolibacter sp. TaxID=2172024 RepID=UPI002FDC886F